MPQLKSPSDEREQNGNLIYYLTKYYEFNLQRAVFLFTLLLYQCLVQALIFVVQIN
jgi:hypothetical protein